MNATSARQPVELGHSDGSLGLLRRLQCRLEFGPAVERISTFAGFDLGVFGDDLEAFSRGERGDSLALRLQAKAGAALLLAADAIVGDEGRHIRAPN